jgi:maltodextrin utilization protein YvdJ
MAAAGKYRKRKDGKQFASPSDATLTAEATIEMAEETMPAALTPKQNTVVMQVHGIQDVLSGNDSTTATMNNEEELGEDEEWEYYDDEEDATTQSAAVPAGRTRDESVEQLLVDVHQFHSVTNTESTSPTQNKASISGTVFNLISTIVTIDFFVVIALLVWFLTGIFYLSVFKDNAVQIVFNMNFERVTQPVMGILMNGRPSRFRFLP